MAVVLLTSGNAGGCHASPGSGEPASPHPPRRAAECFAATNEDPRILRWETRFNNCSGNGVRTVLVDTGLDWHMAAFRGISLEYVDFTGGSLASDPAGHGTRSAAILLCTARDGTPALSGGLQLGVCKAVGFGMRPVARALRWALLWRAQIVVLPFGRLLPDPAVNEALAALARAGTKIYASAGNRGPDLALYPATFVGALAVSGAEPNGRVLAECYAGSIVDLIAPGVVACPISGRVLRGSSVATVVAAGVGALALEAIGDNNHA